MHLEVKNLHTYYGLVHMLKGVSLNVNKGEIISILGRNGAGKTTTIKSIMGLAPSSEGSIILKDEEITNFEPHKVAKKGISFVPASKGIFSSLTAYENLKIFHLKHSKWNIDDVFNLFPKLKKLKFRNGNSLSGGEQQMLAIGRSLVINPSVIMLDEPSQGLAPMIVEDVKEMLIKLKKEGMSIILVEQNLQTALDVADRVYILDQGKIVFEGKSEELSKNKKLTLKFLGVST
ncbi:ABC transporter ATP-binding protein [Alphaproteobacteria bacterium]|nr:ABC transporter ATP-binding protein [Alphaproteobacteria bacterium]MDC1086763.1 ABC transporter ATP-binding protein [Alphaproteobacteria bacterium]